MDKMMFKAWVKAQTAKQAAKEKLLLAKQAFYDEEGDGGTGIIVAIILIIIAVSLAIIFRDKIGEFVGKLFNQVDEDAQFGVSTTPQPTTGA